MDFQILEVFRKRINQAIDMMTSLSRLTFMISKLEEMVGLGSYFSPKAIDGTEKYIFLKPAEVDPCTIGRRIRENQD